MTPDDLAQLNKEWRERVMSDMAEIKQTLREMSAEMQTMGRELSALHTEIESTKRLQERVESLEDHKSKSIGFIAAIQLLWGAVIWMIARYVK